MTDYPEPRCRYCEHWQPHPTAAERGLCRRYPPTPSRDDARGWGDLDVRRGVRIETDAEDWCGEYSLSLERWHELGAQADGDAWAM